MRRREARAAIQVVAPLAGTVAALEDVPDRVFAGGVIGPGLAIDPDEPAAGAVNVVVAAPCAGRAVTVYAHAVVVAADVDRAVLVHPGVGAEGLDPACYDCAVEEGQEVDVGGVLLAWSPACVRRSGRSSLCPVVALQADPDDLEVLVAPGEHVAEGQPLFAWR